MGLKQVLDCQLRIVFFVLTISAMHSSQTQAALEYIESDTIRVEVFTQPYKIRFIEKQSAQTLLERAPRNDAFQKIEKQGDLIQVWLGKNSASPEQKISISLLSNDVTKIEIQNLGVHTQTLQEEFLDGGERYYGAWEYPYGKNGNLDNRGANQDLLGGKRGMKGADWVSARAPFYFTSKNYGIYVNSSEQAKYSFGNNGKTILTVNHDEMEYYFLYGASYAEILAKHNQIAGASFFPPDWALGSIWWRDDIHNDIRGDNNHELDTSADVLFNDLKKLRELKIPVSAFLIDRPYLMARTTELAMTGWGDLENGRLQMDNTFPNPKQIISQLKQEGVRTMLWIANRTRSDLQAESKPKGYLFTDGYGAADIRIPGAYQWFQEKLDALAALGIHGYKIDRGDEHNFSMVIATVKEVPSFAANFNASEFPKLAAEGLAKYVSEDRFLIARSLFDRGRAHSAVWNGDAFDWTGLKESIKHAIRSGFLNFPMWGSDTGGYKSTTEELFARWAEFNAYAPMMEVLIGPSRTPWYDFSPEYIAAIQKAAQKKQDLIPYTKSFLAQAVATGMPVVRAMFLEFPEDSNFFDLADQYMYGSEMLVAPVYEQGKQKRWVVFPAGKWLDLYSGTNQVIVGPVRQEVAAPLDTTPVFAREGAIIPHGDIVKFSNNWQSNWKPSLTIEIFPVENIARKFSYYNGNADTLISQKLSGGHLEVEFSKLLVEGKIRIYCKGFQEILMNSKRLQEGIGYTYDSSSGILEIPFTSAATSAAGLQKLVISGFVGR